MPSYIYQATERNGVPTKGELTAENASAAVRILEQRGLTVDSIQVAANSQVLNQPNEEQKEFYARIETALSHRESLIPPLKALADELSKSSQPEIRRIIDRLRTGGTAEEWVNDPTLAIWLPILLHGVSSEASSRQLGRILIDATSANESRRQLHLVLVYPVVLFGLTILVLAFLSTVIVPVYASIFNDFGLLLPWLTRIVVNISNAIRFNTTATLLSSVIAFAAVYVLVRLWQQAGLTMCLFGTFAVGNASSVNAMAMFTGILAELLNNKAPLAESLRIAGRGCQHVYYSHQASSLANHLESSSLPIQSIDAARAFPGNVLLALQLDGDGSPNVSLLRELSVIYKDRVRRRSNWSTGMLGPVLVVMVGIVVGLVVLSLFMPLVKLVEGLQ